MPTHSSSAPEIQPDEGSRYIPEFLTRTVGFISEAGDNIIDRGPGWKRQAAAFAAAQAIHLGVLGGGIAVIAEHIGRDDSDASPQQQIYHKASDEKPSVFQQLGIPPSADLPPVLSAAIHDKQGDTLELESYKPKFVGAYRSTEGLGINIYAATQPGKEAGLDQNFDINPQSIEFMIREIATHIKDAPDNPSKAAILKNLQDLKTGVDERVIDLVFDVSPDAGCLDAKFQLAATAKGVCKAVGVTLNNHTSERLVKWPIVVSAGSGEKIISASSKEAKKFNKAFGTTVDNDQSTMVEYGKVANPAQQQDIVEHELVHGLSNPGTSNNSYKEGDNDHEITDWLLGEGVRGYDFRGATAPSPKLKDKIFSLVESGDLKPILSVKKTN